LTGRAGNRKRKNRLAALLCLLTALLTASCAPHSDGLQAERAALHLAGIPLYDFNAIRTGDGLTAFAMPHYFSREDPTDLRLLALERLETTQGWHVEAVPAQTVSALIRACHPEIPLFPADDAVFEAWYFREGSAFPNTLPNCKPNNIWTLGFFDADAAWWLCMDSSGHSTGYVSGDSVVTQAGPVAIAATCVSPEANPCPKESEWVMGCITQPELARLMRATQEEAWPQLYPDASVTFDRWRWEDRIGVMPGRGSPWLPQALQEAGITDSRSWVLSLIDEDTGLLIRYSCER